MLALTAALLVGLLLLAVQMNPSRKTRLTVFHAGSLAAPMRDLARIFEQRHPAVKVVREASGSRMAARKITQLGRQADVLAVADYLVIEDLVMPRHADWYLVFGRNRMVLAYTERSTGAAEITPWNWFEILLEPGTTFGHSDPNLDPCGYRTLMTWELAEAFYERPGLFDELQAGCPPGNVRPSEVELLPLLESMDLDYVFNYESVARQHHLQYVRLPALIDLGSPELAPHYAGVSVDVTGSEPGTSSTIIATPIVYAATIPAGAQQADLAEEFIELLVSDEGQEVFERNFQTAIHPALANDIESVPRSLRPWVAERP
jgi:molybdate/tungstate transport system substrate-binding protein